MVNVLVPAGKSVDLLTQPRVTKEKINQSKHLQIAIKNGWLSVTKTDVRNLKKRERQAVVADEEVIFDDLSDVDISGADEDDVLTFENGKWVNKPTVELIQNIVTTTSLTYSLDKDVDDILLVNTTATITLPTAVGIKGYRFIVKNVRLGATVTVDTDGTETIDGELTQIITEQYISLTFVSDGSNWSIV